MAFRSFDSVYRFSQRALFAGLVSFSALAFWQCNDDPSTGPAPAAAALKIISPKAGDAFNGADTNRIIFQIDTTLFQQKGLYFAFSADSGKCWAPDCGKGLTIALKLPTKTVALRTDTLKWVPAENAFVPAGQTTTYMMRIKGYPPDTNIVYSGFFTIKN